MTPEGQNTRWIELTLQQFREEIREIKECLNSLPEKLEKKYVGRNEYLPVRNLLFGAVGTILIRFSALFNQSFTGNSNTMILRNYIIPYSMLSFIALIGFLILYWLFYPIDVIDITSSRFINVPKYAKVNHDNQEIEMPVYKQGATVDMEITYNKYIQIPGNITKILIKQDEPNRDITVSVIVATKQGNIPIGVNRRHAFGFIIPLSTPPGIYIARTTALDHINPLKDFPEDWYSSEFLVVEK